MLATWRRYDATVPCVTKEECKVYGGNADWRKLVGQEGTAGFMPKCYYHGDHSGNFWHLNCGGLCTDFALTSTQNVSAVSPWVPSTVLRHLSDIWLTGSMAATSNLARRNHKCAAVKRPLPFWKIHHLSEIRKSDTYYIYHGKTCSEDAAW